MSSNAVIVVANRLVAVGAVGNLVDGAVEAASDVADKALQDCRKLEAALTDEAGSEVVAN